MSKTTLHADVAVIGAGFGGSLTALLCERIGLSVVLIERGAHPRFTIGESSTPMADLILADLAERYDLPRLAPLTKYGTWRRTYPGMTCGLKRGFSYFHHHAGEPFAPRSDHANELLVTASPNDEQSDTHWFRADVDHFFVSEVRSAGIPYFDRTEIERIREGETWHITARRGADPVEIKSRFVVDASGVGGALRRALDLDDSPNGIRTNSRTVYGHFENVRLWEDVYDEAAPGDRSTGHHPFPCDAAALHHVFDGGWMWVLRFDNGITSAGFVLDATRDILDRDWDTMAADEAWASLLGRFPSIARQFENARAIRSLTKTRRQQRACSRTAGSNWVMLPYTAGFVDPLHSPGNAFTLLGIERLIRILSDGSNPSDRVDALTRYEQALRRDVALLDTIIHGCFVSFAHFELMSAYAMFYFAGAHTAELRRRDGSATPSDGFLLSHDPRFVSAVRQGHDRVCELAASDEVSSSDLRAFQVEVADLIEPYNQAGLCDPTKRNMYDCT
ncbi:MAG: FAD-dependent oxidoreductase [Planctomycetes bacterium]|nr:FAD-dependent oxidoreductase [Planctomycetota bacterium]